MDLQNVIGLVVTAMGGLAALLELVRAMRRSSPQDRLLKDIEIRNALHPNSRAEQLFDKRIHEQAVEISKGKPGERDPIGIGAAVAFLVLGIPISIIIFVNGGWWWLLSPIAAFLLLFGIVGLFESGSRKERDDKGNAKK